MLRAVFQRIFTVPYEPRAAERPWADRVQTQTKGGVSVDAAVLGSRESHRAFGVRMASKGLQPVWLRVVNQSEKAIRLDFRAIDPLYFTPLEAAHVCHFVLGRRLLGFGLLAWLLLPLLPLLPFKLFGVMSANRRMDGYFKANGFRPGLIAPGEERSGFVFATLDEGLKQVHVRLVIDGASLDFPFLLEVPGLALEEGQRVPLNVATLREVDETELRQWAASQPRATTNHAGSREGDPLNLVVVGDLDLLRRCFGARWDQAEVIDLATCWKTAKAFLFDTTYRSSPISPLYVAGRRQDVGLQRSRGRINERLHLRLWQTPLAHAGQPVWIGQISRDIGVRFTWRTWNLTTHRVDPDVDEARDYLLDDLLANHHVRQAGLVAGVGAAPAAAPRRNLTGDPYFTDGARAVLVLSKQRTAAAYLNWLGADPVLSR